jgi:hypothetical protein
MPSVDGDPDPVALHGVLMMRQVCTQLTPPTSDTPICRRFCRGCRWHPRPPLHIVIVYL